MDIEAIIKQITEEVYSKLQAEGMAMPAAANVVGSKSTMLAYMKPNSKLAEIKAACKQAASGGFGAILLPQWFVPTAAEELAGSSVQVATIVGLPGGMTSSFAKYAEVKQAVVGGAQAIIIPLNMRLCEVEDYGSVRNDLAEAMVPCKGKAAVYAMIEVGTLSAEQLKKAVALSAGYGVDGILLSCVTGGKVSEAAISQATSEGICVGVYGGAGEASARSAYQRAGASCFVVAGA